MIAEIEASSFHEHLPMTRIRFVLNSIFVEADNPIQNSDLRIAIWGDSETAFDFQLKDFCKLTLIPEKV